MEAVVLPSIGLLIIVTLMSLFYTKKHILNIETKIYSKMIILSFLFVLINLIAFAVAKLTNNFKLIEVFQKIYMSILVLLNYYSIEYCLMVFNKNKELKSFNIISLIILVASLILIFILPLNVIFYDNILDGNGPSYNITIINCIISFVFFIVLTVYLLLSKQHIKKVLPFIILVFLYIIGFGLRKMYPELIFEGFFYSYALLVMYFTIENPDIKMLDELIKNRKIIERNSEEKSMFIFKMTQELKKTIKNINEEVKIYKNNKLTKEEADIVVNNIFNNNNKMLYLINDVIGISPYDNNNIAVIENTYNIYSLIKELELRVKKELKKELDIKFTIDNNIPKELYGDSIKLKQILISIINNSIKYTDKGFVHIEIGSITKYDVCRLIISIKDSGKGISIDKINELLSEDIEINDKDYLKLNKLDINLKIITKIIKLLNGTIYITSEETKGTEIIITLDQYIKMNNYNQETEKYIKNRSTMKKVLIVNDNNEEIRVIKEKLQKMGYDVNFTPFSDECIQKIKNKEKYDIILIDDDNISMSGITLLQELNKLKNKSKKIVLLEPSRFIIKDQYLKDGFDDYIEKNDLLKELEKKCK